jgi:hypothetical protein
MWGHCLGALALLRAGEREEAAQVALQATSLALLDPPVLIHGINAFDKLCQALFGLVHGEGVAIAERKALAKALPRMLHHLQKTPRLFEVARPLVALETGTMEWLRGRRERALGIWEKGMHRARDLDLPYHEGRLARALATAAPQSAQALELRARGDEILERLELPAQALDSTLRFETTAA